MIGEIDFSAPPIIDRVRRNALIVGLVALALCAIGAVLSTSDFLHAYLMAYLFYIGVAVGSLAILMLQYLSGGAWGFVIRRILEAATRTLPLLAVLFVPILIGMNRLYPWTGAEEASKEVIQHKHFYLNTPFFVGRAVFYFAVWILLTYLISHWSRRQDEIGGSDIARRLQVVSAPGLLLYGLTVTFAAIDWVMSLEPEWYSTIFGLLIMIGQALSAMAVAITTLVILTRSEPFSKVIIPRHILDLGKLLLAFVMIWAYFSYSQLLLIWAGNLPEEIPWYIRRLQSNYVWIGIILVLFHFAFPFLLLLSRNLKRHGNSIIKIAILMIVMRFVDLFWLTAPEFGSSGDATPVVEFSWMTFVMPVALGGIWLWFFCGELKKRPLLPMGDLAAEEILLEATMPEGHHA